MSHASRTNETPDWHPTAPIEVLHARARLLEQIRRFFRRAGVLEVETPIASACANTDPALESLAVRYTGPAFPFGCTLYLQTSPEFSMKRLLAAGSGPIYQICKVFRDGERGRLHNPEFTLLEWYRPGFSYHQLMDEVAALVRVVLGREIPDQRFTYRELFRRYLGLDPHRAEPAELRACAAEQRLDTDEILELSRDGWLDLLLSHCLTAKLHSDRLTFVYDYPASQAALARIRRDACPVAERFELFFEGKELANGFQELTDAGEQKRRFDAELAFRAAQGLLALPPMDDRLLAALEAGLPACSGVALGIDRLLMVCTGARHIDQVLVFPLERA